MTRPEFLTNRPVGEPDFPDAPHETVGDGINDLLASAAVFGADSWAVDIATAYFNPAGWELLAARLEGSDGTPPPARVRLLLGAEVEQELPAPRHLAREVPPEARERVDLESALKRQEEALRWDRSLVEFQEVATERVRRLVAWLNSGRVEVRRLTDRFLHGKSVVTLGWVPEAYKPEGAVVGSANMTRAGLSRNLELSVGRYDPTPVSRVAEWFEWLWRRAEKYDLADLYEERTRPHDPRLIWLKMLWEKYGEGVLSEARESGVGLRLTEFQEHGAALARELLDRNHGVIVSDGVGLGKTYIAGRLVQDTVHNRQRALVVVPRALRETWRQFFSDHQIPADVVTYEQVRDDPRLGGSGRPSLHQDPDDYTTVAVDEAHAFRNPASQRGEALRQLLSGDPPKEVVLLTATPVNNSVMDLYHLIRLFAPSDAQFADRGIPSLLARFKEAARRDVDELNTGDLFDVIDAVMVKRTRQFVRDHYEGDRIWVNGEYQRINFPEPVVTRVNYDLAGVMPGFFDRFAQALGREPDQNGVPDGPEAGEAILSLARYAPSHYRLAGEVEQNERQVAGLLRSGLLKRFESSSRAFAQTCSRMADSHDDFLSVLEDGWVATAAGIEEWKEAQAADTIMETPESEHLEPAGLYDVEMLRAGVLSDRDMLRGFAAEAHAVKPEDDPKLRALADELAAITEEAEHDAGDQDARTLRKTIVFTYFADTADWIAGHVSRLVDQKDPLYDPRLRPYAGRIAVVHGARGDTEEAVKGFAPERAGGHVDRHDLLIATDVLAEGVNLQNARHVVNYDLPWNPMRLVQRHGRVDRIGSPHQSVFMRCFFPDRQLDYILELVERLNRKIAQAAVTVGVEGEVLPGSRTSQMVFGDITDDVRSIAAGDSEIFERGGTQAEAASSEDFRQELRRSLHDHPDLQRHLEGLAWGAGGGVVRGHRRAYVFCARAGDHSEPLFRTVDAEDARFSVSDNLLGALLTARTQPGEPGGMDEATLLLAYDAWDAARKDIHQQWSMATDPRQVQPEIPKAFRDARALLTHSAPPMFSAERVDAAYEALGEPYPGAYRRVIRRAVDTLGTPEERAGQVVEAVEELGMKPSRGREALPRITEDDIHLVTWLAVVPEGSQPADGVSA